ncbi:Ppx/GppA phosphatase family protein [Coraliomargarita parva]|uniref:Ppx/GppA phosphatase family protein n=1 Tax=Coraliomargarita parva TaxID=3014050 RepID=UPI0022B3888A|nr:hypothetical protein [Coraliomargarita parva]
MSSSAKVAVIDVGSNSIKLLVARQGSHPGTIDTCFVETIETRISAGISKTLPSLTDEAMKKGCATIVELLRLAHQYEPAQVTIVATSAVRDAINGMDFTTMVEDVTGFKIRVLKGTEEATYIGRGLACDPHVAGIRDFIQMDIGGGSLELIRFHNAAIEQAISLQLGAVRLTERFIENRDATVSEVTEQAIRAHVTETIRQAGFSFEPQQLPLLVTGGAFVISRAMLAFQQSKDIEAIPPVLRLEDINRLKAELCQMPLHERMAVPHLPASRADIIPTALITIEAVLRTARRTELTHSFYNLRYGIAAELLQGTNPNA